MATIFCASGGSNTAPYETWAKAATDLQTAITAAAAGDTVVLQHNAVPAGDAEVAADKTYAFGANNVLLVSGSNDAGSAWTYTTMGAASWVGNSTVSWTIIVNGAFRCAIRGLTFRVSAATAKSLLIGSSDGQHIELEDCRFWMANTATGSRITFGNATNNYIVVRNPTFVFSAVAQAVNISGLLHVIGGSVLASGSAPTTLFGWANLNAALVVDGFDASHVTGTLCGVNTSVASVARFSACKLGVAVTVLATQTVTNKSSTQVFVSDCSSGDTHGLFGYYDALGSAVSDTGIKFTGGAAAQSWKVVTSANASAISPFVTPWVSWYHSGAVSITPRLEVLRDGSATAYTNGEVWGEFLVKTTTTSTQANLSIDRVATGGTAAAQAAGTDTWDGANVTHWAGKLDSGSAITPAEVGDIRGRVCVGLASATVYVDPIIRI